jgi:hypothetical protein
MVIVGVCVGVSVGIFVKVLVGDGVDVPLELIWRIVVIWSVGDIGLMVGTLVGCIIATRLLKLGLDGSTCPSESQTSRENSATTWTAPSWLIEAL